MGWLVCETVCVFGFGSVVMASWATMVVASEFKR